MASAEQFPRAFAVHFSDLERWDPASFHGIVWHWPKEIMKPVAVVLKPRKEKVDRDRFPFHELQPITIHFDGSMDRRKVEDGREYSMELWFAHPGDIVVSKIDLKNGAVGIVPPGWNNVVVTNHFAVYEPDRERLLPEYFQRIIQAGFFKAHLWRNKVGAEGRKEVKLSFLETQLIPIPRLKIQNEIIRRWRESTGEVSEAESALQELTDELNTALLNACSPAVKEFVSRRYLAVPWSSVKSWDLKSARAGSFRVSNPSFKLLGELAIEATELVRPWEQPDKAWPVYGVDNDQGVFFSHYQKGSEFRTPYKRIKKDWFFHNPTRSSVGSLGIVPDVPEDAITSPEYQVWRVRDPGSFIPGFVAMLIRTPFFISLVQMHRVGAVKQRLYVENLLQIPVPPVPISTQLKIASTWAEVLRRLGAAKEGVISANQEVEQMILGIKKP